MVRLIVAEKPSVARDLARVLKIRGSGQGVIQGKSVWITWCIGHLVELCDPAEHNEDWKPWRAHTLPMLPERFQHRANPRTRKQFNIVRKLMRDSNVQEIINACDAGREGELIFRLVYDLAGCTKPVRRLWLSSLTDGAIRKGFSNLRPSADFDPLADAARCRSEADWIVGMNATRALTLLARRSVSGKGPMMTVGRVQTPTLAMLAVREDEIDEFTPEPFWSIYATFHVDDKGTYEGQWFKGKEDRFTKESDAQTVLKAIQDQQGTVALVQHKKHRDRHPLLYDLTQLQRRANQRFGLSAKDTLSAAQALYEKHKLITYPRTDSCYLTTDMVASLPKRVQAVRIDPYKPFCDHLLANTPLKTSKRIVDNSEVGDHHAIIPTSKTPNLASLPANERNVYDLIVRRFLCVFYPDAIFATTRIETEVASHRFLTRGRVRLEAGWQEVDPPPSKKTTKKTTTKKSKNANALIPDLPNVSKGDTANVRKARLHKGMTKPPKRFNEASLLQGMEGAGKNLDDAEMRRAMKESGLGTPATRAGIIETLLNRKYIRRAGKNLVPTPAGRNLIKALQHDLLKSPELTGSWEARLTRVANGKLSRDAFMKDIYTMMQELVPGILQSDPVDISGFEGKHTPKTILGSCPVCETSVFETPKAYTCSKGRDCSFVIFKEVAKRPIEPDTVKLLLSKGHTPTLQGFTNRSGKSFDAALQLTPQGTIQFLFNGAPNPPADTPPLGTCPVCKTDVFETPKAYTCSKGRDCSFVIFKEVAKRPIEPDTVKLLLSKGHTPTLQGFTNRSGKPFDAALQLNADGRVEFLFNDAPRTPNTTTSTPPQHSPPDPLPSFTCPSCNEGKIIRGRRGWGCSNWRSGCRFVVSFTQHGRTLSNREASALFGEGQTDVLNDLTTPDGHTTSGRLILDLKHEHNVRFEPPREPSTHG